MRTLPLALVCALLAAQPSLGATVSFYQSVRPTTAAEIASDPALAGKTVYSFYLTSDADILSINEVTITIGGTTNGSMLYQNAAGSDVEPPNPLFVAVIPALGADSWISTPGGTSSAGGGFSSPAATWFDSDPLGPATLFQFARLTFGTGLPGSFHGNVALPSVDGQSVVNVPFPLTFPPLPIVPEPASLGMICVGIAALIGIRRRNSL